MKIAGRGDVVNAVEEILVGGVKRTEDVVGVDIVDVIVDEGVVAMADEKHA